MRGLGYDMFFLTIWALKRAASLTISGLMRGAIFAHSLKAELNIFYDGHARSLNQREGSGNTSIVTMARISFPVICFEYEPLQKCLSSMPIILLT